MLFGMSSRSGWGDSGSHADYMVLPVRWRADGTEKKERKWAGRRNEKSWPSDGECNRAIEPGKESQKKKILPAIFWTTTYPVV